MIFDRTAEDVEKAIQIRAQKVQKSQELTNEDVLALERGTLTINTLNRIETRTGVLNELFEEDKYFVEDIITKLWDYTDFFKQVDFDRIVENVKKLVKAYIVYDYTPQIKDNNFSKYQTLNTIEKILHDLDVMISDVKSHYRECGAYECGGE